MLNVSHLKKPNFIEAIKYIWNAMPIPMILRAWIAWWEDAISEFTTFLQGCMGYLTTIRRMKYKDVIEEFKQLSTKLQLKPFIEQT
jgi:hypothetical protein